MTDEPNLNPPEELNAEQRVKAVYQYAVWSHHHGGIYDDSPTSRELLSGSHWWNDEQAAWEDAASRLAASPVVQSEPAIEGKETADRCGWMREGADRQCVKEQGHVGNHIWESDEEMLQEMRARTPAYLKDVANYQARPQEMSSLPSDCEREISSQQVGLAASPVVQSEPKEEDLTCPNCCSAPCLPSCKYAESVVQSRESTLPTSDEREVCTLRKRGAIPIFDIYRTKATCPPAATRLHCLEL